MLAGFHGRWLTFGEFVVGWRSQLVVPTVMMSEGRMSGRLDLRCFVFIKLKVQPKAVLDRVEQPLDTS